VASFLVPEVDRRAVREKLRNSEDKYLMAAHKAVHPGTINEVEKEYIEKDTKAVEKKDQE
jgi:hypothetical protein